MAAGWQQDGSRMAAACNPWNPKVEQVASILCNPKSLSQRIKYGPCIVPRG